MLALHAVLLVVALPDFRVSIDSGYHVSLARWYGEHGTAWWDHINFGPGGRPNLQGPAMHMAIGALGRVLGGTGDDYVLANAILGVLQWAAALFTAYCLRAELGRRHRGAAGGEPAGRFGVCFGVVSTWGFRRGGSSS